MAKMSEVHAVVTERESFLTRHPVISCFALTYAISQTGALLAALPLSLSSVSAAQEVCYANGAQRHD